MGYGTACNVNESIEKRRVVVTNVIVDCWGKKKTGEIKRAEMSTLYTKKRTGSSATIASKVWFNRHPDWLASCSSERWRHSRVAGFQFDNFGG
jgi:hypothetical protein